MAAYPSPTWSLTHSTFEASHEDSNYLTSGRLPVDLAQQNIAVRILDAKEAPLA
jgi:hypothetical protein